MNRKINDGSSSADGGGSGADAFDTGRFWLQFSFLIEIADFLFSLICGISFIFIFKNIFLRINRRTHCLLGHLIDYFEFILRMHIA